MRLKLHEITSNDRTETVGAINLNKRTLHRTMKINLTQILSITVAAVFMLSACAQQKEQPATQPMEATPNTLTQAEIDEGWMLLFDGESTDGWRGYQKETFPNAWMISDDGSLHIQGSGRGELGNTEGGDIIYDQVFSDFHFKVEWKVAEAANAGIFYRGSEDEQWDYIWKTAPEMQVLDNVNHPDAALGKDGNRKAGSLYDLIPADPQNAKLFGEWNSAEVIARGNNIQHIQNGEVVVEYTIGSERMAELIADSKWPGINPNWGDIAMEGIIGLQDHGDDVWFRNIKIKELK